MPHDIDVRSHFVQILDAVAELQPDSVVISGDLCFSDPSDEIYAWIAEQLKVLTCPVHVMAGNHDTQSIMHRHFTCEYHPETEEIYCEQQWHGVKTLFLDSARGVFSENQYQWLKSQLSDTTDQIVVFIHHPPAFCGVPHMDMNYAFREISRLQRLLTGVRQDLVIFCGHYHVERELSFANQHICITPSTFFQIDATEVEFKIDHHRPGYRVIELNENGTHSYCQYL
jgi:Icc protein